MNYPLIKPKYYISLFKEILTFIKKPQNTPIPNKPVKEKVYDTIGLYILKFVFLIPVVVFFALVYDPDNIQSVSMAERFSPMVLLLVGGVILPFVEEIAFRLSLVFTPLYCALSSSAFCYYFLSKAVFHAKLSAVDDSFPIRVSIALSFGAFMFLLLNIRSVKAKMTAFWTAQFRSIFYISCLVFAWIHIFKYELIWLNFLVLPIITLPQLFSAIIYGYTRVSFGFRYPLILHMTMNSIAISLSLLSSSDLILF